MSFVLIINVILSFGDLTLQSITVQVQAVGRVPRLEKHCESSVVTGEIHEIFDMCTSWWGNLRERDHLGDLGVDGWIILERISGRWDVGVWTGLR
jgi:hypothetical protein